VPRRATPSGRPSGYDLSTAHMKLAPLLALATLALLATAAAPTDWQHADAPRTFAFPRDHGRHDGFKIEWWYFTGTCTGDDGHRFGYELTFFRSALAPPQPATRPSHWAASDLYLAHAAVTDVDGRLFAATERLQRGRPGVAWASDRGLDVSLVDWSATQRGDGTIRLVAADAALGIDLTLAGGRGPFPEGPGGVNVKATAAGRASYYYSMTRLRTTGTLAIGGKRFQITDGLTWMDHEFSTDSLAPEQVGWDWFGLQLADGTDLMVYRMRDRAGATNYLSGTRVGPDGAPHYLAAADITLAGDDPWTSPASGAAYPQRWHLTVDGRPLVVQSELATQELTSSGASSGVTYWEGAASVTDDAGRPAGRGYLEMTGYAAPVNGAK
jgi:predicted secreted hydrolase